MTSRADYLCLRCGYQWRDEPGPVICPDCGHMYVKWRNYDDFRLDRKKEQTA